MKIWLSIFASFIVLKSAFAQMEKDTWMVGGGGSFLVSKISFLNSGNNVLSDRIEVSVSALISFWVLDKLAGGIKFKDKGGYSNANRFGIAHCPLLFSG